MSAPRALTLLGLFAAVGLLLAPRADAQSAATFFGSSRSGSSFGHSGPDRFGVPRLRSLRGDHLKPRGRGTVPINVNSLANGTANDPIRPERRPRRPRRFVRPGFRGGLPTSVIQLNNQVTIVNTGSAAPARRRRAVRNVDVVRARAEAAREEEAREGRPAAAPAARETPETPRPAPLRTGVTRVPLVEPLTSQNGDEELDPGNCVTVRITTPGGIEWRHRVALDALGASSVSGAASLLQGKLGRGDPLVLTSPGGGFTVPAAHVESLIVGPCR